MDTEDTETPLLSSSVEDPVEVYRCTNPLEADRALVEVLEPAGIAAVRHDRVESALPAPATAPGAYFIAVSAEDADAARELLREALEDSALDRDNGTVLG